jgi:hypothetical protein
VSSSELSIAGLNGADTTGVTVEPAVKGVGSAHTFVDTAIMPINGTTSATPKRLLARPIPVSFVSIFFPAPMFIFVPAFFSF